MWTVEDIMQATGGQLIAGHPAAPLTGISIDSRQIHPGEAFVAIKGTRLDGHAFLQEALRCGAGCVIVSKRSALFPHTAVPTVVVSDTTKALGDLARFHRRRFAIPIIAVTGSCGKTTTKELIAHLMGGSPDVLKTEGTQNNHIGVPLTLLKLTPEHRIGVVELGSNHCGEIAYLAALVEPTAAIITNVGPAHLEFFGSVERVLSEKLSLLDVLPADGAAILPGAQLEVCLEASRRLAPTVWKVTCGMTPRCDIEALDIQRNTQGLSLRLRDRFERWQLPLVGTHNVENALAAVACAWVHGVPLSTARERLANVPPLPLRSHVMRCDGVVILNDCYNANPLSCARALETLRDLDVARRVAILGDMLELGPSASTAHEAIGRLAAQLGIDRVIAIGQYAPEVVRGVEAIHPGRATTYETVDEALEALDDCVRHGDGVLIKGSRRLHLERITETLLHHVGHEVHHA